MSLPAIPRIQQIRESIIHDARRRPDNWQAEQPPEPDVTRRSEPNRDRAVNPRVEPVVTIDSMQPAPHVIHSDAEARERVRLEIDVTEMDGARSGRANKSTALPIDARVAHRTFGIVPDYKLLDHQALKFESSYFAVRQHSVLHDDERA